MSHLSETYREKVYAGWLGKCIGVRFGAPIENWTYHQIKDFIGEINEYLPMAPGKIFQPDDDTSVPLIFLRAMEDYGIEVTAEQMGKTLLNYIGDQHGSLWWGGYGQSTEHTAYLNLKNGMAAPASGSAIMNGLTVAEQIGGQIFSDVWGMIVPDNPLLAAAYARKASSVTHDGNGVYGGMFVAAMVSAAFTSQRPMDWINAGLSVIPADSEYARVVQSVVHYYEENPHNWRDCFSFIEENFGYDRYSGIVHIIPNAGVIIMGLLYGEGDFSKSIAITNMAGWDTDCNVGNVGCIVGTAVGLAGIKSGWRDPQNDCFIAASVIGSGNIVDIPGLCERIVQLGQHFLQDVNAEVLPKCHFTYPGSTHGFHHWGEQRNILLMRQKEFNRTGALQCVVRLLKKKQEMGIYRETFYHADRLSSNYYGAGFSPTIYPGQTVKAKLFLPEGQPDQIFATLYVQDSRTGKQVRGGSVQLKSGESQELTWQIPDIANACLTQVGLVFRNMSSDTWKGEFYLEELDWFGRPSLQVDFSNWPMEYGAAQQWTYLRGFWRCEEDGYHASGNEVSESYTGLLEWQDLELGATLKPITGDTHLLLFRVQGALRAYAAGLTNNKLVLYKKTDGQFVEVASQPYMWQHGESIHIYISVQDNLIHVKSPGVKTDIHWEDTDSPYKHGMIGLANFANCHTCFEVLHVC